MIVTRHAVARFIERVAPQMTPIEARQAITVSAATVAIAAGFGARCVKRGDGSRLLLDGATVTTVLAPGMQPDCLPGRAKSDS